MKLTKGRCLCGAIRYEFEGKPDWVVHCHCESCRRHTSSAVATILGVKLDQFHYLEGTPSSYESSPGVWRYFCGNCGSPMGQTIEVNSTGHVHVYAGTLEDPSAIKPQRHLHAGEQLAWFELADDLPRFQVRPGKGVKALRHGPKPKARTK